MLPGLNNYHQTAKTSGEHSATLNDSFSSHDFLHLSEALPTLYKARNSLANRPAWVTKLFATGNRVLNTSGSQRAQEIAVLQERIAAWITFTCVGNKKF